jgi:hypothetical protein
VLEDAVLVRSALWAVVDSRQSAHTRILAVPEKGTVPMITCVLPSLQGPSSATLVFFALGFVLELLPVLVFVFLEQVCREWSLITYAPHLIFSDVLLLSPLGPIAWIGLLFLLVIASCGTGHADVE